MKRRNRSRTRSRKRRATRRNKRLYGGADNDESKVTYVCSRSILKSCDVFSANDASSTKTTTVDISSIKDGSVVYVTGSAVPDFANKMGGINAKFILVSGDCDESIPDDIFPNEDAFKSFIESDKIIHWFSQNTVKDHPKLSKIPIGVDYHTITAVTPVDQEKELIGIKNAARPLKDRKPLCYSNFHINKDGKKFTGDRDSAINGVPKDLVFYEPGKVSRTDTWTHQAEYGFILSPHGNGLDCHRTWEALCLGSIPVVKTSPLDPLYNELPVLIVKEWSDVTKELLEETLRNYSAKTWNMDRITLKYWMDLIRSKK